MSSRIVFNGQEYPSVDAMPADVRKQYDDVMRLLADAGGGAGGGTIGKVMNVLKSTNVTIRVNGKEYSPDDLPPALKAIYDKAMGEKDAKLTLERPPGLTELTGDRVVLTSRANPRSARPGISRELIFLILAGVFLALWLLLRH